VLACDDDEEEGFAWELVILFVRTGVVTAGLLVEAVTGSMEVVTPLVVSATLALEGTAPPDTRALALENKGVKERDSLSLVSIVALSDSETVKLGARAPVSENAVNESLEGGKKPLVLGVALFETLASGEDNTRVGFTVGASVVAPKYTVTVVTT